MARTTPQAISDIIAVDSALKLKPFISSAASLVDKLATYDTSHDAVHSQSDLATIETWLAAHFYAHRDQLLQSKSEGRASGSFQGQTAMHLNSTQYGQTAMLLDTTGFLAKLNKQLEEGGRRKVGVLWLGTPYADQVTD